MLSSVLVSVALAHDPAVVCHRGASLVVDAHAVPGHLGHGDHLPTAWYADADGDGAGDSGANTSACQGPPGTVADDGDCDDGDPGVHPGAPESCDGIDQDCDDAVDDGAPDADEDAVCDTFDVCPGADDLADEDVDLVPDGCDACPGGDDLADEDADLVPDACDVCPGGDDFLDEDADLVPDACDACPGEDDRQDVDHDGVPDACDQHDEDGDGAYAEAGDCDDTDPTAYPGAPELCDGLDSDCDGAWDYGGEIACGTTPGVVDASAVRVRTGGSYGPLAPLPNVNSVRGQELAAGGSMFGSPFVSPVATFVTGGDWGREEGAQVLGDLDGQGSQDVGWGVVPGTFVGRVLVMDGAPGPRVAPWGPADARTILQDGYVAGFDWFGMDVEPGGDVTGDGQDDLLVAAYHGAYVVPGPLPAGTVTLGNPTVVDVGYSKWLADNIDLDGDGTQDLVVSLGGCAITGCGSNGGTTVLVVWGGTPGVTGSASPGALVTAGHARVLTSFSGRVSHFTNLKNGGDVTGDGRDDLLVMDRTNTRLRVLSLHAGRGGAITETQVIGLPSSSSNNQAGPIATTMDLDGDARRDLVITKPEIDASGYGGELVVLSAPTPGSIVDLRITAPELRVHAEAPIVQFGQWVTVGDFDGDGLDDIATNDGGHGLYVFYPNR